MISLRKTLPAMLYGLPAVSLALSPFSSRALNLTWIALFTSVAIFFALRYGFQRQRDFRAATAPAAKTLVLFFSAGLLIKLLAQWHWGVPGQEISFELNAMVAAFVALALARLRFEELPAVIVWLALTGFAVVALKTAIALSLSGDVALPTNAVNWSAGLALMLCICAGFVFTQRPTSAGWYLMIGAVILLALAVFISSKRGSFFAIFWVMVLGLSSVLRMPRSSAGWMQLYFPVVGVLLLLSSIAWLNPGLFKQPVENLVTAAREVSKFVDAAGDKDFLPEGSLDTRLYIYRLATDQIGHHPLLGIGLQGKQELVRSIEQRLQVPLFHLHSEPLDAWVAYGLPGLVSTLMLPLGLIVAGWQLRKIGPGSGLMLTGAGLSHFFSGLSNVNTFHNYYQTMFALAVVLPFLIACLAVRRGDPGSVTSPATN